MNESLTTPRSVSQWIGASLFSVVLSFLLLISPTVSAADRETKKDDAKSAADAKKTTDKRSGTDKKGDASSGDDAGEDLFLREGKENQKFLPDIFRCPECGYEQDEPGTCPDHDESALILVRSKGKNPLEPSEVDGNEDIVVDIPLTGLSLKKAAPASGTVPTGTVPRAADDRKEEEAAQSR